MDAPRLSEPLVSRTTSAVEVEKIINVKYQKELNLVTVRGSSVGDCSSHKYDLLIANIGSHFKQANSLHLYFNFDFLDNSAIAYLGTVISVLNEYHAKGKTIRVFWSYLSAADNMNDEGEKLKTLSKFEFRI